MIRLPFDEPAVARTPEFVLWWGLTDNRRVDLGGIKVLEFAIIPDVSGRDARASLAEFGIA